jgi:hypothetical protein
LPKAASTPAVKDESPEEADCELQPWPDEVNLNTTGSTVRPAVPVDGTGETTAEAAHGLAGGVTDGTRDADAAADAKIVADAAATAGLLGDGVAPPARAVEATELIPTTSTATSAIAMPGSKPGTKPALAVLGLPPIRRKAATVRFVRSERTSMASRSVSAASAIAPSERLLRSCD